MLSVRTAASWNGRSSSVFEEDETVPVHPYRGTLLQSQLKRRKLENLVLDRGVSMTGLAFSNRSERRTGTSRHSFPGLDFFFRTRKLPPARHVANRGGGLCWDNLNRERASEDDADKSSGINGALH